ncbi:PAS domain-containing sensor histidine kinase [Pseudonocardia alni]|uniref:PAS domain-containing sensor histidine kinase n=1 Tax=Pseudonocardia alni TaxID=33907 RepID=UPI0033F6B960
MTDSASGALVDGVPTAALVTHDGVVEAANADAAHLLGDALVGRRLPAALADAGPVETEARLTTPSGVRLDVACIARRWSDGRAVYLLRDITEQRAHQDRVAALARTAARVSDDSTIDSLLHAMAEEIHGADGIVAVQIITAEPDGENLTIMGATGFDEYPDFFERLMACRDLGAPLASLRVMRSGRQFLHRDRKRYMLESDFYRPLWEYVEGLDWRDFVATPMLARGRAIGALLVYLAADHTITPPLTEFLDSMAEQAALAVDYHRLIDRNRAQVRVDERQRLARDLHDSVIQQVFAIGMQARGLEGLGNRPGADPAIARHAHDLQDLAQSVQRDLRSIVQGMRTSVAAEAGLRPALVALSEKTADRSGLAVTLDVSEQVDLLGQSLADDLYDILSEGVHNVVKHAGAHAVTVSVTVDDGRVAATVEDDGVGPGEAPQGYGLASMRYRASRWGGSILLGRAEGRTRLSTTLTENFRSGGSRR